MRRGERGGGEVGAGPSMLLILLCLVNGMSHCH
jgi:hypothetical protein